MIDDQKQIQGHRCGKFLPVALLALCLTAGLCYGQGAQPTGEVGRWLQSALEKLRQETVTAPSAGELLDGGRTFFAMDDIGRHVLGKDLWNTIGAADRRRFLRSLEAVLCHSMASQTKVDTLKVHYLEEKRKDDRARVKLLVEEVPENMQVVFSLRHKDDGWKIFDVNVNGQSLLRSYMVQLRPLGAEKGFAAVMELMDAKEAEIVR